ncbi:MAG: glycosyltransferase family 4 protein [Bacteroidaceae bacterium]|nr:glycosyltransferase family 4 protein [Bacteroidaceae bacterium]
MKHILIISANFPPEPVTSAVMNCDLAEALSGDYRVTVLTPPPSRPREMDFSHAVRPVGNYRIIQQESYVHPKSQILGRFRESYSFGRCAVRYIRAHHKEIDFVYNDGWQFVGLYLVARACVKYGVPYLVPIQDIYPESLLTKLPKVNLLRSSVRALMAPIDRYYIRHASRVRTISPLMADYLAKTRRVEKERFLVIANWQDDSGFNIDSMAGQGSGDTTVRFMFAGNNSRQANVALIINAFVDADLDNAELYIMGGGNERERCEALARQRMADNVFFGSIPEGKVPEVQSRADVMVLALTHGTATLCIPSKLVAYMLSGKAVLASVEEGSDTARILHEVQCGMVTLEDDRAQLTEAFRKMAAMSKQTLRDMGSRSRRYAETHLSREANLKRVVETITRIVNENR